MSRLSSAAMASVSPGARAVTACAIRQAHPARHGVSCRVRQQGLAASQGQNRQRLVVTASLGGSSFSAPGKEAGQLRDAPAGQQGTARAPVLMGVQAAGVLVIMAGQVAGWPVTGTLPALAVVGFLPQLLAGCGRLAAAAAQLSLYSTLATLYEESFDLQCKRRKPAEVLQELRSDYVRKRDGCQVLIGWIIFANFVMYGVMACWAAARSAGVPLPNIVLPVTDMGAYSISVVGHIQVMMGCVLCIKARYAEYAWSLYKAGQRRAQQLSSSSNSGSS